MLIIAVVMIVAAIVGANVKDMRPVIVRASEAMREQSSYRVKLYQYNERTFTGLGPVTEVEFDARARAARLLTPSLAAGDRSTCEVVATPSAWYINVGSEAGSQFGGAAWVRVEPPATIPGTPLPLGGSALPFGVGERFVRNLHKTGSADVEGVRSTRYEGTFRLQTAIPGSGPAILGFDTLPDTVPITTWVDDDDLLRKVSVTFDLSVSNRQIVGELTFSDFGRVRPVTLPPSEDTVNGDEAAALAACLGY